MKTITLEAAIRDISLSKGRLNQMRNEGNLPGVVYGAGIGSLPIIVSKKELTNILGSYGLSAIINLRINGRSVQAMVKEIQRHPLTGGYWHVDFSEISMDKKIRTELLVHFSGEPAGVKDGGVIQYGDTTVEIECLPKDLPERFTLDISNMKIGDKLTVADLTPPEGVKILSEPEQVLITVIPPALEKEDEEEQDKPESGAAEG